MPTELVTQTHALNANWLNCDEVVADNSTVLTTTNCNIGGGSSTFYYQPWTNWTYPVYVTSPSRPIKLTLSEIERLRKAAKGDGKLKAILAKFTDQIEITVDFE